MRDMSVQDNALEFVKGSKVATATLSSRKYINRVKKLATKFPEEFQIITENEDGSIVAHIPVKAIKINYTKKDTIPFEAEDLEDVDEEWVEIDL